MAWLEEADDPKEDIDVEEEEGVDQEERVLVAPCPQWGDQSWGVGFALRVVVAEEGEVE